jgi:Ni,Fe-hydrogenase III small subunit/Pyruvate/2-oxoacid:ferredoxin oxidoreductase delta subunit
MPLWTLRGLHQGQATTDWPLRGDGHGQVGVLGMPRVDAARCDAGCHDCAEACPTRAIEFSPGQARIGALDYGRCIGCQLCVEACPTGALSSSGDWAFGVREREDLRWQADAEGTGAPVALALKRRIDAGFSGSFHIRHVDAGSCNGCESELQALNNPFYNLHRLGIFFTPSPRFADLLLVTGVVTPAMHEPLHATWQAMPDPRMVMAMGTCAVGGGIATGTYAGGHGVEAAGLPVDLWLPGCPPNPAAVIQALLVLLERAPQRVRAGRMHAS